MTDLLQSISIAAIGLAQIIHVRSHMRSGHRNIYDR